MSFDWLPPELICDIVESVLPDSYSSRTYRRRQETLCRLCLVSRQFRQIAQPLLFEIVAISSEDTLVRLLRSLGANADIHALTLWCDDFDYMQPWMHEGSLKWILQICPALSSLTIHHWGPRKLLLNPAIRLENLSNLHLAGLSFPHHAPLSSLRSLTLYGPKTARTFCFKSNPVALPSLRYLALTDVEDMFRKFQLSDKSMLIRLLPQLEAWSIDLEGLIDVRRSGGSSILAPFLSRALVDCNLYKSSSWLVSGAVNYMPFQHLRLVGALHMLPKYPGLSRSFSSLEAGPRPGSLRSIYLDIPRGRDFILNQLPGSTFQEIIKICKEKGIEIIFEEQHWKYLTDPVISQEFWRRMKLEQQ